MPDSATRRKFEALVAAAFADGFLAEAEKVVLEQKAQRMGLSTREMHEIIGLGQQRKLSISIPATAAEREAGAPKSRLLAGFPDALKFPLPALRRRGTRRMQGLGAGNPRTQPRRESPPPPAAPSRPPAPRRVESPPPPPFPTYAPAPV